MRLDLNSNFWHRLGFDSDDLLTKALDGYEGALMSSVPALRFEVLHSCVSLVGGQDGNLLTIRSFSGGDDFIL